MSGVLTSTPSADAGSRSARKPKGEGHSRRAEILAAAERIFVEHGYEGATIRKIADEVGLSSTALYMHFSEKGEILQEICRQTFEQLITVNRRIVEQESTPDARLRAIMMAYVDFGLTHSNAYRLVYMTRPIEARDGAESTAQTLGSELLKSFEAVLDDVAQAGRLRQGDAHQAALAFWAGGHGVVSLVITKPYIDWGDRKALACIMIDALLEGLIKP